MTVRIDVLDATHQKQAELYGVTALSLVSSATKGGGFILETTDSENSVLLETLPGAGIRVIDNGTEIFSGPVLDWDTTRDDQGIRSTFGGIDHLGRLAWRNTDPDPTTTPPYSSTAYTNGGGYDVVTGTAAEVAAQVVNDRAGAAALPARQFCTVATVTPAGPTITERLRFRETVAELVDRICTGHFLTPSMRITGSGLVFDIVAGTDRVNAPVGPDISPAVTGYQSGAKAPTVTDVTVGGQGDLTARTFTERTAAPSARWPFRIEQFLEQTQTDQVAELEQAGDERLTEGADVVHFTADVTAFDTAAIRYGRDFFLGDRVPVRLAGTEQLARVTAANLEIRGEESTRTLTVGVPVPRDIALAVTAARNADRNSRRQGGR